MAAISARSASASPRRDLELGLHHDLRRHHRRRSVGVAQAGRPRRCPLRRAGGRPRCSAAGTRRRRTRVPRRSSAPPPRPSPARPTAHVRPAHPASAACRARTGSGVAPPARTTNGGADPVAGSGSWTVLNPWPRRRTTPSKPPSATSRFEPRPITQTATPLPIRAVRTASRSSGPSTSTRSSAGPPTP